jgi:hypothetical protein
LIKRNLKKLKNRINKSYGASLDDVALLVEHDMEWEEATERFGGESVLERRLKRGGHGALRRCCALATIALNKK